MGAHKMCAEKDTENTINTKQLIQPICPISQIIMGDVVKKSPTGRL